MIDPAIAGQHEPFMARPPKALVELWAERPRTAIVTAPLVCPENSDDRFGILDLAAEDHRDSFLQRHEQVFDLFARLAVRLPFGQAGRQEEVHFLVENAGGEVERV